MPNTNISNITNILTVKALEKRIASVIENQKFTIRNEMLQKINYQPKK